MTTAFWDTSALVPLCVQQQPSPIVRQLLDQYDIVVWWGTTVEMRSAFERLLRMGQLSEEKYAAAVRRLQQLRLLWREMQPTETVRAEAERLLASYPLKAADSFQLAAASVWASGVPQGRTFLSGDAQLLRAAQQVGFRAEAV